MSKRWPFLVAALTSLAGCADGGLSGELPDGFPPPAGTSPGAPCRDAADPLGPCDQDLGGATFVDMVCVQGTCAVDCSEGGDFLCSGVVADFLTCSPTAGNVCLPACGAPDGTCADGSSCFSLEDACLPTGAFPTSPCRDDPSDPCDAGLNGVPGADMICVQGQCAVDCSTGGPSLCRQVDSRLTCSAGAGDVCLFDCDSGCPDGFSCFDSDNACLPTGAFPGSPCLVAAPGADPSCGAVSNGGTDVVMACRDGVCLVPCEAGADGDAVCAGVDASLGCSGAADACVPVCQGGACPGGFSCFTREDRCLPTGSFPTSPCLPDDTCLPLGDAASGATIDQACLDGQCVVPCDSGAGGDELCAAVDGSLGCSDLAGACTPACQEGLCPDGFSCFGLEGQCLPTGAFPTSPCRPADDNASRCDQDLADNANLDMVCVQDQCLIDCAAGGDFVCALADPSLGCSSAAGDICIPRCGSDGSCAEGLACFASEGLCLPQGAFPGSPCGDDAPCGELGGAPMICTSPAAGVPELCLVDCAAGGQAQCQAVDPGLSCLSGTSATDPSLCLPNGTFPGALCRADAVRVCDQDLRGEADLDLGCFAGTCQVDCGSAGDALCGLYAAGLGLPPAALTCVDLGAAGAMCAQAGCGSGPGCPTGYHCDRLADACLPFTPLTVLHTADLRSHFDGPGPLLDPQRGGYAHLSVVLDDARERAATRGGPVLTLDGGGWVMGTLFHLLGGVTEFDTFRYLGYDAVGLGGHAFDFGPERLAGILGADIAASPILTGAITAVLSCTVGAAGCPDLAPVPVVASTVRLDPVDVADDALAALYDGDDSAATATAPLNRFIVLERAGLSIGVIGLIGPGPAALAGNAAPVTFDDPLRVARELVDVLRGPTYDVDLVIALSHAASALPPHRATNEIIADQVDGLDLIVASGAADVVPPRRIGDTWIVQAGDRGRVLGELVLAMPSVTGAAGRGGLDGTLTRFEALEVVQPGDADAVLIAAQAGYASQLDAAFAEAGLRYDTQLGAVSHTLSREAGGECLLGNLVTDAAIAATNAALEGTADTKPVDIAFTMNATLRGELRAVDGPTPVTFADAFSILPLGGSPSAPSVPGYPLVEFYLTGADVRAVLEVATTLYPLRGDPMWLHAAGLRWMYDPAGPPFGRVRGIWLDPAGSVDVCRSAANLINADGSVKDTTSRYRVVTDLYAASLLAQLAAQTDGALSVTARDSAGTPIDPTLRVVRDGASRGQLRAWQALIQHLGAQAATNHGLIPPPSTGRVLTSSAWSAMCR